jgi:hypothetical protein
VSGFQTFVAQNPNILFMLWGLAEAWFQLSGHIASYVWADGRLGSRLWGYHPVAPRPLRYGPFVHRL